MAGCFSTLPPLLCSQRDLRPKDPHLQARLEERRRQVRRRLHLQRTPSTIHIGQPATSLTADVRREAANLNSESHDHDSRHSFFQFETNICLTWESCSMTLAPSTWMLATLDECCERYYGWMLNECKGSSGDDPSGLWYPGSRITRFFKTLSTSSHTFSSISIPSQTGRDRTTLVKMSKSKVY